MQLARQQSRWFIVGSLILVVLLVLGACARGTPTPAPAATPVAPKAAATPAAPEAPKAAAPAATPTPAPAKKVAPVIGIEIDTSHPMADDYGPLKLEMPRFLTFSGTSSPGSPYTFFVNPFIQTIEKAFPRLTIRHLPGGTRPNVERVHRAEAQLAIIATPETAMAVVPYKGEGGYKEPQRVMIMSVMTYDNAQAIGITLPGSGFETMKDWGTKPNFRLGALYTGSAAYRFMFPAILSVYNASYDSIKAKGGSVYSATGDWKADLFDKLLSGQVDAIQYAGGTPDTFLKSQDLMKGLALVGLIDEEVKAVMKAYPGVGPTIIPKGTYKANPDRDVQSVAIPMAYATSPDVPEAVVYNLMWAIYRDDGKAIQEAHPAHARYDQLRWQEGVPQVAPYHPGALKYFQARGVKIPPQAAPPADWLK